MLIAVASLLAAAATWIGLRHPRRAELIARVCVLGVAAALVRWQLLGQMPVSRDHTVHLFKAWIMGTRLLPTGRLSGWVHDAFAGYPAGELYPVGSDLWINLFHSLGLGLLSWERAYAFSFAALFLLAGLGCYLLGRRLMPPAFAAVAAILLLCDDGAFREGGWSFVVYWGVWPQFLSTAFLTLGLARLLDLFDAEAAERPLARLLGGAALLCGVAIVAHPTALVFLGLLIPPLVCVQLWRGERRQAAGRLLWLGGAVLVLAFALAAFQILPNILGSGLTESYGSLWRDLAALWVALGRGQIFQNFPPVVHWLGVAGFVFALIRRDRAGWVCLTLVWVPLLASSTTVLDHGGAAELLGPLGKVPFRRFSIIAKVGWFLSAGYALASVALPVSLLRKQLAGGGEAARSSKRFAAVAALVFAAGAAGLGWQVTRSASKPGVTERADDSAAWQDYRAFLKWSRHLPGRGFFRIAYLDEKNHHFFVSAPVHNGIPIHKVGFTPASTFVHKFASDRLDDWRALSVRYVVSRGRGRLGKREGLKRVKRFGKISVYEIEGPVEPPVQSDTLATLLELFGGEHIIVGIQDPAPEPRGGTVTIAVAPHPAWRATADGQPLAIRSYVPRPDDDPDATPTFMQVDLPAGTTRLELRYHVPPARWMGLTATLIALVLLLGLLTLWRSRWLSPRWLRPIERALGPTALATVVLASIALPLWGHWHEPLVREGERLHFAARGAIGEAQVFLDEKACPWQNGAFRCDERRSWLHVRPTLMPIAGRLRSCLWAHPPRRGQTLRIVFPEFEHGSTLRLAGGITDEMVDNAPHAGASVDIQARAGDLALDHRVQNRKRWQLAELDTRTLAGQRSPLELRISAKNDKRRHLCIDAVSVAGR